MRNTKRAFVMFTFYDRTGIRKYLEEQAEKGWLLEKMSSFGWKFRRIEPKKIHFAVTFFPDASSFDPEPSEGQLRFQEFCAHTGWILADSSAQLQVFYNEAPDPVPIETDAAIDVENVHKAVKKSFLPVYITNFLVCLMQLGTLANRIDRDFTETLSSNSNLLIGLCWLMIAVMYLVEIVSYYRWRSKAKKAAKLDGSFVETGGSSRQLVLLLLPLIALALLIYSYGSELAGLVVGTIAGVIGIIAASLGISAALKREKASAGTNRAVTIAATVFLSIVFVVILAVVSISSGGKPAGDNSHLVATYQYGGWTQRVYDYDLPLTIEDLMETDYNKYSYEMLADEESLLLAEYRARQNPRMDALDQPTLWYRIVDVKLPTLYDGCLEHMLGEVDNGRAVDIYGNVHHDEFALTDEVPWGAERAYQLRLGGSEDLDAHYILCYAGRIIEIEFDWEVTAEQKAIVGEILGNT